LYCAGQAIHNALKSSGESKEIRSAIKACEEMQNRLCGDITEVRIVPGRRLIMTGELCSTAGGHLRGVTLYLFNDHIVTTAQGTTKEFEIFQTKAELYKSSVETIGARLKLVECDQVSGLEMCTHVFECDTAEAAETFRNKIHLAVLGLTRTKERQVVDELGSSYLLEEQESLSQAKVRLNNEVFVLRQKEQDIEARLRSQMGQVVTLREEQWEVDYERIQIGLTVDPRTLNAFQSAEEGEEEAGPEEPPAAIAPPAEEDSDSDEEDAEGDAASPQAAAEEASSAVTEETGAKIEGILENLSLKFEALEEVMLLFALQPMPGDIDGDDEDGAGEEEAPADGEAGAEEGAEEPPEPDKEEAGPAEEEAASEEEAAEGEQSDADSFWDVIQRVRSSLGVLGGKMVELDEKFWEVRLAPQAKAAEDGGRRELGAEGMPASEMMEAVNLMQAELDDEMQMVAELDVERLDLEQKCEHALRNLQHVQKKGEMMQKND